MRLRKGDKVEVMNKKEAPVSWHVAEILSGNGHTYHVSYDSFPGMASEQLVETVPRKFVRPCPPLVQGVVNCIAGDIVEVFYKYAWKIAAILKVLEAKKETKSRKIPLQAAGSQNQYLVRLLGCSQELIVDESSIRMRQTWCDDKWILLGKSSQGEEDVVANKPSTSNCYQKVNLQIPQFNARAKKQHQKGSRNIQDEVAFSKSHMISSRSLKRVSPYSPSIIEARNGPVQKLRAVDKGGRRQRVNAAPALEKGQSLEACIICFQGSKMIARFAAFYLGTNFWTIQSSTFKPMQIFMVISWYQTHTHTHTHMYNYFM
ncbi:hypothetical protein CDL12_26600 [Handroanthus impetiginosus]|uniref:Agenet domain-containing protein n=1 Tax=Handroanthus impetiginosus TaxID=429701 RepID=A0A2G9G6F2_9LAMI|nr:hypothetical protein CDL12_26600 [Handroanthus impetiginosus]